MDFVRLTNNKKKKTNKSLVPGGLGNKCLVEWKDQQLDKVNTNLARVKCTFKKSNEELYIKLIHL